MKPSEKKEKEMLDRTRVIAALPGWHVVFMSSEDGEPFVRSVVAWLLPLFVPAPDEIRCPYATPVTVDGTPGDTEAYAVVAPDGDWNITGVQFGSGGLAEAIKALRALGESVEGFCGYSTDASNGPAEPVSTDASNGPAEPASQSVQ